MANQVEFKIRIDDSGSFKKVTMDAEELGKAVRNVQDEAEKAKRTVIKWAEVSQALDVMQNAIGELQGVMQDLTSAYQVQLVAETQLTTIMRQRMGATDGMIQSVKDLCSAQQELGVIGDEVQLSGAQQMATFLQNKQSLDVLIPAMNNLIAQQNGLNATNQDAVSIGNMMGKAMQGQVEVLQRVGITFTDAQKQVLQFGTESERAAMLAQVITDNVGNMNQELAKTDAGKWKQTDNWLGDIKEKLGGMLQSLAPTVTMLSQMTMAATGIGKLATSFYSAGKAIGITKAMVEAWNAASVRMNALVQTCSATMRGAAVSATTLKLAMQGLMVATGVGIAVVALSEAISYLMSSSDDAADSVNHLSEAEQQAKAAHQQEAQQLAAVESELGQNMARLKNFKGSKEQEKKLVQEMNTKYGEAMGYYSTVSQWYDSLTANSKTYCNQMINEIRIRNLANRAADLQQQRYDLTHDSNGKTRKFSTANETKMVKAEKGDLGAYLVGGVYYKDVKQEGTSQLAQATKQAQALYDAERAARKEMDNLMRQNSQAGFKKLKGWQATMPGSNGGSGKPTTKPTPKTHEEDNPLEGSIDWYTKAIGEKKKELSAAATDAARTDLQNQIEGLERELGMVKIKCGIEKVPPIEVKKEGKGILDTIGEQMDDFMKKYEGSPIVIDPEIKIKQKDLERVQALFSIDTSNMSSVQAALVNIKDITNPTAQGLAAAGASCQALGGAMQQLGADSDAAKAGMIMAAIGQVALSFAQALTSASSNWVTWLAFGITGVAQMASIISTLQGFATGGIVGGNQKTGDKLLVRVNSGEMILNAADHRKKPDKLQRIESVSPLWERGCVFYNEALKDSADMQVGIDQTLSLEHGSRAHDDAPDADEGAIFILQRQGRLDSFPVRIGQRKKPGNVW